MTGLDAVRAATSALHTKAERSGIIADILAGRATRTGIALLLHNLSPAYQTLEAGLSRFEADPVLGPLADPALARHAAIQLDLRALSLPANLPLLPAATAYRDRIEQATAGDGIGLIAHAYIRYLGDLNGGPTMRRRLMACLGEQELAFYRYEAIDDPVNFSRIYRAALDGAARVSQSNVIAREAMVAFELNIALSEAVKAAATEPASLPSCRAAAT